MFFNAKILREPRNRKLLFWTDLCAKNGVRMIAYHNKKLESKFEVDFENLNFRSRGVENEWMVLP